MEPLQIITHNIPSIIRKPLISLIGQECYTTLVWNLDISSTDCLRYSLSKVLGFGIVCGGSIVKVPQIIKIIKSGSGRGVSLMGYGLDTTSLLITVAYNIRHAFPFSTFGENLFLTIQNVIILTLLLHFRSRSPSLSTARQSSSWALNPITFILTLIPTIYLLLTPALIPDGVLAGLVAASVPISLSSKIPQIAENYRLGSTGQLSAFLVFNSLAGCLARVFTTSTETKDPILWWSFVGAAALNAVIALQMGWYWNAAASVKFDKDDKIGVGEKFGSGLALPGGERVEEKNLGFDPVVSAKGISRSGTSSPRPSSRGWTRKVD